jgi:hypothetical protein
MVSVNPLNQRYPRSMNQYTGLKTSLCDRSRQNSEIVRIDLARK